MTFRRSLVALAGLVLVTGILLARGAAEGRLRGEVRTAERRPVAGATVLAIRSESPPVLALTATGPTGALAIDGVPAGSYRLIVDAAGFAPQEIGGLDVGGPFRSVVDLVMRPGGASMAPVVLGSGAGPLRAVLRVEGEAGQPLPSVNLRLDPVGHRHDPIRAQTDERGMVALDGLGPGAWRVSIAKAGWTRLLVPELSWPAGELTLLARLLQLTGVDAPSPEDLLPGPVFLPPLQPLPAPVAAPGASAAPESDEAKADAPTPADGGSPEPESPAVPGGTPAPGAESPPAEGGGTAPEDGGPAVPGGAPAPGAEPQRAEDGGPGPDEDAPASESGPEAGTERQRSASGSSAK